MHSHPHTKSGLSLVEVMIALAIFGLVSASALSLAGTGFSTVADAQLESTANTWISSEMEYLRSLDWDEVAAVALTSEFSSSAPNDLLSGVRTIEPRDGRSDQYIVKLGVTWQYRDSMRTLSAITFISENGIRQKQ